MDKEFNQLKTLLSDIQTENHNSKDFVLGKIAHHDIIIQQCGIGKVNSTIGAVEMINCYHPELIISTGVAGGADVAMNPMEVVVGNDYVYHDLYCGSDVEYGQILGMPSVFTSDKKLVDKALSLDTDVKIYSGKIVTGDWFVDTKEKMREILSHFPDAKAVDMESCSIAHTCYVYGVSFISFRIISDVPLKDEKASQYFDFWSRLADGSFEVTKKYLEAL